MRLFLSMSALLVLLMSQALLQTTAAVQTVPRAAQDQHRAMLNTYCIACHNNRAKIGGMTLEGRDLEAAADSAEVWEKVLRKLRGNLMPPPGSPQPPTKDLDAFVS